MALHAELIDPIADDRWALLVAREPAATVFHHPAWIRLLRDQYGYRFSAPCVVIDKTVIGGLPMAKVASRVTGTRLVSLPFSDACGPLGGSESAASVVLGGAIACEAKAAGLGLEIRAPVDAIPSASPVRRFYQHHLSLYGDVARVHASFTPQARRGVAKAQRHGLVAELRTDGAALRTFYALHMRTRRRQGVPTQPKRFVLRFAELFREGLGFVMLVRAGADVVAAAVFLTCNRTVTYKYGASDRRHLDKRPNNLLFVEAIRWGCEHGYAVLDFGRTDLGNHGLRSFKRGWGAQESDLVYTYVSRAPPAPEASSGGRAIQWVIRRGPPSLSRLVGEALYKHVG
jgi:CelD/BcsL family acetyltransferase involved in cellulose biosynthesis